MKTRAIVIAHDSLMAMVAWCIALLARFNFEIPPIEHLTGGLKALPVVGAVQALILWRFGLYRGLWRFASLQDLWNIIRSATLGAVCVALALFIVNRLAGIPRSLLILYPMFLVFLLGGPRLLYRLWKDRSLDLRRITTGTRVLIVGAGESGEALIREMLREEGFLPVGIVDDRTELSNRRIHGVPVLGSIEQIPLLVERHQPDLIVIALPSASNREMQRIVEICETAACPFRTLPCLGDIVSGKVGIREIRQVSIEDLLGRSSVELDWKMIQSNLAGKSVLVTGGAGSIGSELCRQVSRLGVSRLTVFDQSEFNLYLIERELRKLAPHLLFTCVLGDVCDAVAVEHVFDTVQPQIIFHAAAYKHVPIVEAQIREGVRNNVLGTQIVVNAVTRHACERMVLISTDKAVRPSSLMGVTKRIAELICEAENQSPRTRFITVRFGNVLGSAGSVVPLFQQQIEAGGPLTVTHPEATRYFMTIPEASQLILQAAAASKGGEIFVLDMGQPVNIKYLAEQMILLSGQTPGDDIRIVFTGLRPGEKLHEELFNSDETLAGTAHQKLLLAAHSMVDPAYVQTLVAHLRDACERFDEPLIRDLIRSAVPVTHEPEVHATSLVGTVVEFKRDTT